MTGFARRARHAQAHRQSQHRTIAARCASGRGGKPAAIAGSCAARRVAGVRHAARPLAAAADAARARCAHAQSEEHRPRHPQARAGGDHRPVGVRQVEPRVRHAVRRGPAPLCREPVDVCAAVPAVDGQARRRSDRGPVAGHQHRAEGQFAQPALHGGHDHRGARLPAAAVRARRHTVLPRPRARAAGAERQPDGRRRARAAAGYAPGGAGTGGARPQRRIHRAVRADAGAGLRALSRRLGRRRAPGGRGHRAAAAEEDREARHRRGDRSPARAARDEAAAGRELRGGTAHRRGTRDRARTRQRWHRRSGAHAATARAPVFQPLRLPGVQLFAARTRAAAVFVQFTDGCLPALRRPRPCDGVRPRTRGRLSEPEPGRRRGERLGPAQCLHVLDDRERRQAHRLRRRDAVRAIARGRAPGAAARLGHPGDRVHLPRRGRQGPRAHGQALASVRRDHSQLRAALSRDRFDGRARRPSALPGRAPVPAVRRHAIAPRGAPRAARGGG